MHLPDRKINGVVFLGAIISCFIAFVNNFPLVYQDTGSYIHCGFEGLVLYDRPIFYSLFLKYTSLSVSLWYVVFIQGLLVSYLVYLTLGLFFEGQKRAYIFIGSITFLTLCTGFSYNVSILIPDIFTALAVLCLINLLINQQLRVTGTIIISIVFVLSICTQFSSIAVIFLLFCTLFCYVLVLKLKKKTLPLNFKRLVLAFSLFLSCLFIIPATHYLYNKQFKISGSNHVFVMNHFVETGILDNYLNDVCSTRSYSLCAYKNNLGWDFIWSPESPVQKTGGWEANRKEYKIIIKDILSTPKYLLMVIQTGIEYSFKQLFSYDVEITPPQLGTAEPFIQVDWRYKNAIREYTSSLQNQGKLDSTVTNALQRIVILISMVFLSVVVLSPALFSKLGAGLKATVSIILIHNILNSVICSNLSTVSPRFQNRIAWLLPLMCIIIIITLWEHRKNALSKAD